MSDYVLLENGTHGLLDRAVAYSKKGTCAADDYSAGEFSPVFFFLDRDFELRTYTHRSRRTKPARSLWRTMFTTLCTGSATFNDIYIATDLIYVRKT